MTVNLKSHREEVNQGLEERKVPRNLFCIQCNLSFSKTVYEFHNKRAKKFISGFVTSNTTVGEEALC